MTYVIGTAGHVDHGKSTLVEALTGIDPDRLAEEKAREMTIDLGFAWLTLPSGESVGIVDVPGHRDFIENMLAGIGGIDLALFIVAADEGVMPQTREHLAILDLLEVPAGVVALTKVDLIDDPEWIDLVTLELQEVLSQTVLADAPIVPVSARTGEGLKELLDVLDSLLAAQLPRPDRGKPRLPVDRVFTISGFGTVVTGTLVDGSFRVGDEIEIVPNGRQARIRGLQSHKEAVPVAQPGSRVAINLAGVDKEEIKRGEVVAAPGLLRGTTLVDVYFRHLPDAGRPLKHNSEVKFFTGAAESLAHVRLLGDTELAPGATGWLQLRLEEPVALDRRDRFILRYPSPPRTIGGGFVLDPHPPHRWRRFKPEVLERLETLAAGTPDEILLQTLEAHTALQPDEAATTAGLGSDEAASALQMLEDNGAVLQLPDRRVMARSTWERLADQITRELEIYHASYRLRMGMSREELRSRLGVEGKLFNTLLNLAVDNELVIDEGKILRLPGHSVQFSAQEQAAVSELLARIQADPVNTPSVKESVEMVGEAVLQALLEQGELVQVSGDVLFDAATYDHLVVQVETYINKQGSITVAQARDLFGTSRKYVLALLEYLDSIGITRREGDQRLLRR